MESLLSLYYRKYKQFLLPAVIFFLAFFIVVRIALPQFSNISATNETISAQKEEITKLEQALSTLNEYNSSQVDTNLSTASLALPVSKNIVAIFSSLSNVSARTNANIKSFSLKVGDLYSKKSNSPRINPQAQSPFIVVTVSVTSATSQDLVRFSEEIQKSLPLAEVKKIEVNDSEGNYEINFFYKPTNLSAVSLNHSVTPLTPKEKELLNKLSIWAK